MDNTCVDGQCKPAPAGSGSFKTVYLRKFKDFNNSSNVNYPFQHPCSAEKLYTQSSYTNPAGQCLASTEVRLTDFPQFSIPDLIYNVASFDQLCQTSTNTSFNFPTGAIETYFDRHSADGWEFTHKKNVTKDQSGNIISAAYPDRIFSEENSNASTASGIYNKCIVPPHVERVIGYFMCQKLIIRGDRVKPLTMVGTFIVLDRMQIHSSAVSSGLSFYNMHHPVAIEILKDAGVLKIETVVNDVPVISSCNDLSTPKALDSRPHWHPDPGLETLANRVKCSSLATFNNGTPEKFPFRWTSVSADCVRFKTDKCALDKTQDMSECAVASMAESDPVCIKKIKNYFFKDIDRRYVQ